MKFDDDIIIEWYNYGRFKDDKIWSIDTFKNKYPNYFQKLSEYQIKIHIYLGDTKKPNEIKINYKHRITSPHFNHPMELFRIIGNDHMGGVSQFHLPCVRALYNGDNVFMTPSCISAHLTGMNIDYKYFSGLREPYDIINKNRMRGFGTWLNENEIKEFQKYSTETEFWSNLYGTKIDDSNLGNLSLSHKLFHPRLINIDEFYDTQPVNIDGGYNDTFDNEEIISQNDILNDILTDFEYKGNKDESTITSAFLTIGKDGSIIPLQKWVIEAYFKTTKLKDTNNLFLKIQPPIPQTPQKSKKKIVIKKIPLLKPKSLDNELNIKKEDYFSNNEKIYDKYDEKYGNEGNEDNDEEEELEFDDDLPPLELHKNNSKMAQVD